ncbi:MAG: bifunctional molybdenum cofactor biosynthesis protein MoaC/MoaB [Gammaproteobacteria bacterium]
MVLEDKSVTEGFKEEGFKEDSLRADDPRAIDPHFRMIDVGRKRPTRRQAVACGSIYLSAEAFCAVRDGALPKGNVLALAEVAGISGAKKTSELLVMCHPLPLDQVMVQCELNESKNRIMVYAQVAAYAKTGVEMEALSAVNAALLTVWDLTKGVDPNLRMGDVRLLVKIGGKSGVWINPDGIPDWLAAQVPNVRSLSGKRAGIVVMSDRASAGVYPDESGPVLRTLLEEAGADLVAHTVIPDQADRIAETLIAQCTECRPDVLFALGGTGPGPRDVTPEVLEKISDRMLEGLGDVLRTESLYFTDTAWLSRMTAGMVGPTLVIAFPGSPKAVKECWGVIQPFIGDALVKIKKQGFEVKT